MNDEIKHYLEKYSQAGSSFYYSISFLSSEKKTLLIVLCAFWQSVQNVLHECSDPGVARTKLYWWLEDTKKIAVQQAEHPLNKALQNSAHHEMLSEKLQTVIQGILYRLDHPHFDTREELNNFCQQTGGAVMEARSILLECIDATALAAAQALGIVVQQIALLRDLRKDLSHDYIFIPLIEMEEFGLQLEEFQSKQLSPALEKFFDYQTSEIKKTYEQALQLLPAAHRKQQLSNLIFVKLKMALLNEIQQERFQVLKQKTSLTPLRKWWIAQRMKWVY